MSDIIKSFQERYSTVHPLIFARSVERSYSAGELFDILEEIPEQMPVVWDEVVRRWVRCDDILQSQSQHLRND